MHPFEFNEFYNYGFLSSHRPDRSSSIYKFMDKYCQQFAKSVMVMIMHTWSFTDVDPKTGFRTLRDLKLVNDFESFLAKMPAAYEIITASELHRRYKSGELHMDVIRDVELMDRDKYGAREL